MRAAIARVVEAFGGIDILVNNAGIGSIGDIAANDDAEWHRVFDVNVVGIARVTRAALPHLRASAHPAIVNTCSVVASVGVPQRAVYSASKGAVAALTLAMAADHVREGIRVNAVMPGTADTPWIGRLLDQAVDPGGRPDRPAGTAADGPPRLGRRGRPGDRLPGRSAGRLDHRHAARRRRRDGRPARRLKRLLAGVELEAVVATRPPGRGAGRAGR